MKCQITGQFFSVMRALQEEQKTPKDYGTGQQLYHAEVGFLEAVHDNPGANASALAQTLGITKGAVTQLVTRLGEKGLVEVYKQEGNRKQKHFRLTALGETARQGHLRYHDEANRRLQAYFAGLSKEESATISHFLSVLRECVPFCEFPCANTLASHDGGVEPGTA